MNTERSKKAVDKEREVYEMTDRQYLDKLKDMLKVAEKSKDLAEFVEYLKQKIDTYLK